jgi:predicted nucleic-acid-binding protein
MRGIDTNVLVRFLTQDDRRQVDRVDSLLAELEEAGETAYVSTIVLCELAWVLRSLYGLRRKEIRATLEMLLQTAQLQVEDRAVVNRALTLYGAGAGDFSDYVIGLRNRIAGCRDTVTFDQSLTEKDLFTPL